MHNPRKITKCGDLQHIEGFRCPASKHPCRNCHKYGHFHSLCYKKREIFKHIRYLEPRSPKAHQLQIGSVYMLDSICSQPEDLSSSEDSFCLQLKVKCTQVETKTPAPQHLITNFAYKLKPHQKKIQYLRARLDTSAGINIMPASIYKLVLMIQIVQSLLPAANWKWEHIPLIRSKLLDPVHYLQCIHLPSI